MFYFTSLYKEVREKADKHLAFIDSQSLLVQELYDQLVNERA